MAKTAQRAHDASLLGGGELGEDARLLDAAGKLLVREALDLGTGEHARHGNADAAAHVLGHAGGVAGQDLGLNAVGRQRADGVGGACLGRVQEREIADERHVALVLHGERARAGRVCLAGDAQHAHALAGQRLGLRRDAGTLLGGEWAHAPVDLDAGADGEHLLEGSLADHARLAVGVPHDDGEAAALEVKRQLVHAVPATGQLLGGDAGRHGLLVGALGKRPLDDGTVDEVLDAGGEVAVQEGVAQHARVLAAVDVQVALKHDAVLGERARLVGAQHVDGAEVLDGVQALDDDAVAAEVD